MMGAKRMVVGHTVQRGRRMRGRCGGRLMLIDIGISRAYNNYAAAWECVNGQPAAIYQHGRELLPRVPQAL